MKLDSQRVGAHGIHMDGAVGEFVCWNKVPFIQAVPSILLAGGVKYLAILVIGPLRVEEIIPDFGVLSLADVDWLINEKYRHIACHIEPS